MIDAVIHRLRTSLHGFVRSDQAGSVSFETVLILPLLLWFYVGSFVFFDAFKVYNRNVKAAYTVSDMLSRQTNAINNAYLEGLTDVFDYMASQRHANWLQVAQIRWQGSNNRYRVDWSRGTNGTNADRIKNTNLAEIEDRLPPLVNGERILVVRSYTNYVPAFAVGLSPTITMSNFVVTSPRFAPQLAKN